MIRMIGYRLPHPRNSPLFDLFGTRTFVGRPVAFFGDEDLLLISCDHFSHESSKLRQVPWSSQTEHSWPCPWLRLWTSQNFRVQNPAFLVDTFAVYFIFLIVCSWKQKKAFRPSDAWMHKKWLSNSFSELLWISLLTMDLAFSVPRHCIPLVRQGMWAAGWASHWSCLVLGRELTNGSGWYLPSENLTYQAKSTICSCFSVFPIEEGGFPLLCLFTEEYLPCFEPGKLLGAFPIGSHGGLWLRLFVSSQLWSLVLTSAVLEALSYCRYWERL